MKTGSTSIQLNLIHNKKNMFKKYLKEDNFQIIDKFNYIKFGHLRNQCLIKNQETCDYTKWKELNAVLDEAYHNAIAASSSTPINTLFSLESWSLVPKSNFTFSLLEDLFSKWDLHVIIFYRPFADWILSRYTQYRKGFTMDVNGVRRFYLIKRYEPVTFPQYLRQNAFEKKNEYHFRDTLSTYNFFRKVLRRHKKTKSWKNNIHVLQTYASDSIEKEFLCNLPGAIKSCQHIKFLYQRLNYTFPNRNTGYELDFSLTTDLITVEAWYQDIVSVSRHNSSVALEEKMKESNLTKADLPQVCITDDEANWIWKRTLKSEKIFGSGSTKESHVRKSFLNSLNKKKFCSVNVTAVLEIKRFRKLFDHCEFQSPNLINGMLKPKGVNQKWAELDCASATKKFVLKKLKKDKISSKKKKFRRGK